MRKLASIQKITNLSPIEGADNIEVASVLGWKVVVKKGEFYVGELVVYCEIDSILPDWPEFKFLKPRGMRIKTIRLKGQISQGICFKLDIVSVFKAISYGVISINQKIEVIHREGYDVTQMLGIIKYEPPCIHSNGPNKPKGNFPSFIPKTDEVRIQTIPEFLEIYKDEPCVVTEKLDGTSVVWGIDNES